MSARIHIPTRRSKYGVAPKEDRTIDGITFDSKREAEIWQQYSYLQRAGKITSIERQVRYPLHVAGILVATYVADLRLTWADGLVETVEVKGAETAVWKLKHKLFCALYPEVKLRIVK
jgi:Protein of unknown function (DUF1064)